MKFERLGNILNRIQNNMIFQVCSLMGISSVCSTKKLKNLFRKYFRNMKDKIELCQGCAEDIPFGTDPVGNSLTKNNSQNIKLQRGCIYNFTTTSVPILLEIKHLPAFKLKSSLLTLIYLTSEENNFCQQFHYY